MKISSLAKIKEDERGKMYSNESFKIIKRIKGSISAKHTHSNIEILYLIEGEIELKVGGEIQILKEPSKIEIPPETYHEVKALTNIILLEK